MTHRRTRSQNLLPSPSMAKLRVKLAQIVSRQDQVKLSFIDLKSQIKIGLVEAEDVFNSLAVPLMKLVGLKSAQMAEEGRSSTIYLKTDSHAQSEIEDMNRVQTLCSSSTSERECRIRRLDEDFTNKAIIAGKELINTQKSQFMQLMQHLKQVESGVNSNKKHMFETIDNHKDSIHTFMQKAVTYIQQSSNDDGENYNITLKLLKAIYNHIVKVLGSIESGVDSLVKELTEEMCNPFIEYLKRCKAEITDGMCPRLLVVLEDMRHVENDRRVELEQMKKRVREAEDRKLEALNMLKQSEERNKKLRQYLEVINANNKLSALQEERNKDDKLLWEMLKNKQNCQQPESPFGPNGLLPFGTSSKRQIGKQPEIPFGPKGPETSSKRQKFQLPESPFGSNGPYIPRRPSTRAFSKLKTDILGSSPSVTTSLSRKRVAL